MATSSNVKCVAKNGKYRVRFEIILFVVSLLLQTVTYGSMVQEISTSRIRPGKLPFASRRVDLQSLSGLARLGPRSSFRHVTGLVHTTPKGVRRVRLMQTYGGYDVIGTAVEAEVDVDSKFSGQMYGGVARDLHKDIPDPRACRQRWREFLDRAIRLEGVAPKDISIQRRAGRRIVYAVSETQKAKLAYEVKFFYKKNQGFSYPVYIFDACSGDLLASDQQLKSFLPNDFSAPERHPISKPAVQNETWNDQRADSCPTSAAGQGGNKKIGLRTYNGKPYCLNVRKLFNACTMEGDYSVAIDNEFSQSSRKKTRIRFRCNEGFRDSINEAYGVANDAFYYGEVFGQLFTDKYDMRVLNYKPRLVVHYGLYVENAYSDGTDTFYGDGRYRFYPLTGIDIVAHELAHGITSQNSGLIYSRMSGGINEAFSDISAVTTRAFEEDDTSPEWTLGANIYKGNGALRYFSDPTLDGKSIKSIFRYRNNLGVHSTSGVFNHAFYRLVKTQRMNIFEAYKCFLDANLYLWRPSTGFYSGACNVMQAAYDNGFNHRKVRRAFRRVGIPLIFCWFPALSTTLFPGETRQQILVSATRSPIFKLKLDHAQANSTSVEVIANNLSTVTIVVGKDVEATRVIAKGDNLVSFDNRFAQVYVKLVSLAPTDVKVKMTVSNTNLKSWNENS